MAQVASEEIEELKRISGDDFELFLKTYETVKDGFKGEEAIEKINKQLPEASELDKTNYMKITRSIREKSPLLRQKQNDVQDRWLIKIKSKLKDLAEDLLDGINPEKIDKAKLTDIMTSFGILVDKLRLLDDKPTEHIAVAQRVQGNIEHNVNNELKSLQNDLRQFISFAQSHGLKLPNEKEFEKRLIDKGEIIEAKGHSVNEK